MARRETIPTKPVTIILSKVLMDRVATHVASREEDSKTLFFHRAVLNQLENEGDFEVRDLVESEVDI